MRKGISLIELLIVFFVMGIMSVPLARFSTAVFRDVPRAYRMIQCNTSMLSVLKQMRKDVAGAKSFPESAKGHTSNSEMLLIELADETVYYQLKDGEVIRQTLENTEEGNEGEIVNWRIPDGKIRWSFWEEQGEAYAVEVQTHIEHRGRGNTEKKLANSYVYYLGASGKGSK